MKRGLKIAGYAVGGLVVVFLLLIGGVYGFSGMRFNKSYDVQPAPWLLEDGMSSDALLERGAHLATIRGCRDCHMEDLGGGEFVDDPVFGLLWTSNLTAGDGGVAGTYEDADWDRAIRHGIGPDGKPLYFMPSHEYWPISDDDLAAMVAYFRSLEPVDRAIPDPKPGPLARTLYLTGALPLIPAELIDHQAARPRAPTPGPNAEYGAYLATGCVGCHGEGYSGGKIPGAPPTFPPAANITMDEATGIGSWTEADFIRSLREGVRPDGTALDPAMPVAATKHMTDDEIVAIWLYLNTLEPKELGNR